ncbi:MAG: hypothetical protein ABW006_06890 [Hyphomicrobium sp.]
MAGRTAQRQSGALSPAMCKRHRQFVQPASLNSVALLLLLVVAGAALVHVSGPRAEEAGAGPKLPAHVADLRDVILTAARSGNIDELKSAFEVSGAVPDLGISPRSNPIAALKDRSADPQGRDTLAALVEILEMPPAALPLGNDIENNLIYVWPYLSTRPLDKLKPAEQVDLYRLVPPGAAAEMLAKKRWLWWRVVIAADGTWMMFKKGN